ncbi:MAG: polyhydroxyalkanoate synthesis regulator [Bacteroidetes bacterium]|nr:polyhydroxyalkanoate synthesis regulator [Bacteroidota bacterium]
MFENLKHAFDKGVEYAFTTSEKIEKAAKEFAKENNLTKEEAKKLYDQWLKKSDEMKASLEKQIVELQKTTIKKMNLVTKEDYKVLEARIKKLEGTGKKPAKPARKSTPVKKAAIAK